MVMDSPTAPVVADMKSSDCHDQSTCHFDLGAQVTPEGVQFRLWAPKSARVEVVLNEGESASSLEPEANGYWSGVIRAC